MPLYVPDDTNLNRITWVTNTKVAADRAIICPNCKGLVTFNAAELLDCKATGKATSTPCRANGVEDWHPGWPPEPWLIIPEDGGFALEQTRANLASPEGS